MYYDVFSYWCEEYGYAPAKVLTDIDMNRSAHIRWKNGTEPSNPTKKKIADYFGVSVDDFMNRKIKKAPAQAEAEVEEELTKILQEFKDNPELRALFSLSRRATPQELREYAEVIKALRKARYE